MDKFFEFIGRIAVPWLTGFFILIAMFLLTWFLLGEIFGAKIRQEVKIRAKRIRKIKDQKREKAKERLNRIKKSAKKRKKEENKNEESLLTRIVKAGVRKIHKPES